MGDNAAMAEGKGKLPVSHGDQGFDLESVTGCFTGVVVDYSRPCSGMPDRPCHISRELPAWNELLFPARMQLQEMVGAPGKLSASQKPPWACRNRTIYTFGRAPLSCTAC
ncbi:hypothetical protein HPB50_017005 [Hyalomma asiaticum]|uniref:Uncharacterized protein n=1 Tax=Hyalomma asiaticum TaxID=266040 RepID=A0ACB7SP60_HYAAI|nr:hypothetical protein HPB50_017005 [Hyalomma asiaticum]